MLLRLPNPSEVVLQVAAQNQDGSPKTGIAVSTVRVYHLDGASEVEDLTSTSLVQVGATSFFRYIWEPVSLVSGEYFIEYYLKDSEDIEWMGAEDLIIIDLPSNSDIELIKKIQTGRWRIRDNQMVFYDEDGTSELLKFDLKNLTGSPSQTEVFERVPTS